MSRFWLLMGEVLSALDWVGMTITIAGVAWVIMERKKVNGAPVRIHSRLGILLAFLGASGQAIGLALSKYGMGNYDAFAANQIRVIAGIGGFCVLLTAIRWWPKVFSSLGNRPAMLRTSLGAFFGPFLGVGLSLLAVQYTETGVAATIMAIVPVMIIPPAILVFKEHISLRAVLGALLAVGDVSLLFL